jgi:hypothetical protein
METQIDFVTQELVALPALAIEINALQDQVEYSQQSTVIYAARCGAKLIEAKKQVQHGNWENWLKANCKVSIQHAQKYMQLAKQYPELLDLKAATSRLLPNVNQAIELLSAPEELKTEVMARIESGDDVTVKEIRELKKQLNEQGKLLLSKNCELFSKDEQLQSALKMIDGYIAVNKQYPIIEKAPADYEQNKNDLLEANNKIQQLENELKASKKKFDKRVNEQVAKELETKENEIIKLENRKNTIQKSVDEVLAFQDKIAIKDRELKSQLGFYENIRQALLTFAGNMYDYTGMINPEVESPQIKGIMRALNDCERMLEFILDNRPPPTEKSVIGYERVLN